MAGVLCDLVCGRRFLPAVRAEVLGERTGVSGVAGHVVFERVEIDQEDGGVDGVAGHW